MSKTTFYETHNNNQPVFKKMYSVQPYSHDNVQESVETNDSPAVGGDDFNKEIHCGNQRTGDEPDNE